MNIANGGVSKDMNPKCRRYNFNDYENISTIIIPCLWTSFLVGYWASAQ